MIEPVEKGLLAVPEALAVAALVAPTRVPGVPANRGRNNDDESPPWILADSSTACKTLKSEIIMIFSKISMDLDIFL
jgi:hypothetical protein